jgi:hypothetical protein
LRAKNAPMMPIMNERAMKRKKITESLTSEGAGSKIRPGCTILFWLGYQSEATLPGEDRLPFTFLSAEVHAAQGDLASVYSSLARKV